MKVDIITCLEDKALLGDFIKERSWANWKTFLKALQGLPMTPDELEVFGQATRRGAAPSKPFTEAYVIAGRRAGKSQIAALIAAYLAIFGGFEEHTKNGQEVFIFLIATDKAQAKICLSYVKGILEEFPGAVETALREEIRLRSRIVISVKTASFRSGRGFQTAAVIMDELAFWRSETSANPAEEVVASLLPGLLPEGLLLGISSPYARRGYLWETYREHYGRDDENVLVWKAPTLTMNPTYSQHRVDKAVRRDPAAARSEYLAEFREDLEGYLSKENVEAATGDYEALLPEPGVTYKAFTDPSGGKSDMMTLAIGHSERGIVVVDRIESRRPPFSPEQVVGEFADILHAFRCHEVVGDRFGGQWVESQFRKHGISYRASALSKSDIYLEAVPLFTMSKVLLPRSAELEDEITGLERRATPSGKDQVDHAQGYHDDLANAALGAAVAVWRELAQAPTPEELEARLPVMKKHRKQTVQETIRDFNKDFMSEYGLSIPLKDAKKLGLRR